MLPWLWLEALATIDEEPLLVQKDKRQHNSTHIVYAKGFFLSEFETFL